MKYLKQKDKSNQSTKIIAVTRKIAWSKKKEFGN